MDEYNKGIHTVYDIKYHVICVAKYRYRVLQKPIASRLRELIRQGCGASGITIVRRNIGKDTGVNICGQEDTFVQQW